MINIDDKLFAEIDKELREVDLLNDEYTQIFFGDNII